MPRSGDVRTAARQRSGAAGWCTSRRSRLSPWTSSGICARRSPGLRASRNRRGVPFVSPTIAIRTGDTPAAERARFQREPADLLITTPESLFLLLTSNARDALVGVHTIIVDEIHALVPTKRGAHLALSLERLAARCAEAPQRIGLSATQRPLEEVARFLGGTDGRHGSGRAGRPSSGDSRRSSTALRQRRRAASDDSGSAAPASLVEREVAQEFADAGSAVRYRPVTIVDAGKKKALKLRIEVPVEDMARLTTAEDIPSGPASVGDARPSIWSAIHPRLLELIRAHRSTLIFVNSRRLAERLAGALNELAGETLVRSHHGSIARPQRLEIEDLLKAGRLRRARRHVVARARHRHGRHRSGGPDRGAADGRQRPAANRPRRPPDRRRQRGHHLPEIPRRSRGVRRGRQGHARRDRRSDPLSAQSARRRRTARCLDDCDGPMGRGRSVRHHPARGAVRRARTCRLRRHPRHALGTLPVGRIRRAAAARHLGPRGRDGRRARRRQARGDRQRRHHPRSRALRRLSRRRRRGRRARRRARRRDGIREPCRRNVRARRLVVAHRGDHARPGGRLTGPWRAGQDAVLERRPRRDVRSSSGSPSDG